MASNNGSLVLTNGDTFIPWDNPHNILSRKVANTVNLVVSSGLTPLLWVVGCVGNSLSAAVFSKQGLRTRINLCLFCLALADMASLTSYFLLRAEHAYREFVGPSGFLLTYFLGMTGFNSVSTVLSAVIACERCFCVVSPLKAQRMLSTRHMAIFILVTSTGIMALYIATVGPKHSTSTWTDPETNVTVEVNIVTQYYKDNQIFIDIVDKFAYNTALPIVTLFVIFVTTAVTGFKLQQAATWRLKSVYREGQAQNSNGQDEKEKKTQATLKEAALTRMLITASILYMACTMSVVAVQLTAFFVPDLSSRGRFANLSVVVWAMANFIICINNSCNFFIYLAMGSKFRETLMEVACCCCYRSKMASSRGSSVYTVGKDKSSVTVMTELTSAGGNI